jgi:hypothetical protein
LELTLSKHIHAKKNQQVNKYEKTKKKKTNMTTCLIKRRKHILPYSVIDQRPFGFMICENTALGVNPSESSLARLRPPMLILIPVLLESETLPS